jgi:CRP-like cAMP-binding protein
MELNNLNSVKLSHSQKINTLEKLYWSQHLDFRVIKILASYVTAYQLNKGQVLFAEGVKGACLVCVINGAIVIQKENDEGKQMDLTRFSGGNVFGEQSFFDNEPRSASAVAEVDSIIYLLAESNFIQMQKNEPYVTIKLLLRLGRILSLRLRKTTTNLVDLL